eukprot:gene2085-716_t
MPHLAPYAEELWHATRAGRLRLRMAASGAVGLALAHDEARAKRARVHRDRRSVLTHPQAYAQIWLADARTLAVYDDPRGTPEVLRRLAEPHEPYLWAHVDGPLTQRIRDAVGKNASLFADGCLAGMQLGALRPRGAALLGDI